MGNISHKICNHGGGLLMCLFPGVFISRYVYRFAGILSTSRHWEDGGHHSQIVLLINRNTFPARCSEARIILQTAQTQKQQPSNVNQTFAIYVYNNVAVVYCSHCVNNINSRPNIWVPASFVHSFTYG